MGWEYIGVDGLTIAHSAGSPISSGSFTITSTPSVMVFADGKGVFSGPLTFTFMGGSAAGFVANSINGGGTINPTTLVVKADGALVIRQGDTGTLNGIGITTPDPPGAAGPISGGVEITVANQTEVKAK